MMANWEILNKEFDTILNNITDSEWNDWINNIDKQKEIEKMKMLLEANLQAQKIIFEKIKGKTIINEILVNEEVSNKNILNFTNKNSEIKSNNADDFSLAA